MASQLDIEGALFSTFLALGHTPGGDTSVPNGPKVTTSSLNYTLNVLYAEGRAAAIGDGAANRYEGLFQVTIRSPALTGTGDAAGTYEGNTAATAVATAFARDVTIAWPPLPATAKFVIHLRVPTITQLGNVTPEWYTTVVRIPFWADVY